jgi:hypothetical protein
MRSRVLRPIVTACLTASLTVLGTAGLAAAQSVPSLRVVSPAVALPRGAHALGPVRGSAAVHFEVYLTSKDARLLAQFAAQVTNTQSPDYGRYLRKGQFATYFGAAPSVIRQVTAVLRGDGLTVSPRLLDGLGLKVSGHAATVAHTFGSTLERVRLAGGRMGTAMSGALTLPASISSHVLGVSGLSNLVHLSSSTHSFSNGLARPTTKGRGHSFGLHSSGIPGAPAVCPAATQATQLGYGGITDDQVATAYGVDQLYSAGDLGSSQTIGVYELEPFSLSDVAGFDQCYFGSDNTSNITVDNVDGGPGAGVGSGESALDIENVSALAPNAHINVYQAPNTLAGALDAYGAIVSDDTAQVVTTSWGLCEAVALAYAPSTLDVEHLLFEQAAAQGQTVFSAAGDDGSDDCAGHASNPVQPYLSVDDPSAQPYVVAVGGTTAQTVTDPPAEQVWNDGATGGATGGGISSLWGAPAWQRTSTSLTTVDTTHKCGYNSRQLCRALPDVTAFADEYTGITIEWDGEWGTIGGTSSAAPIWAAMLAEINDSTSCTGHVSTAHGVGFASPLLYEVANNPTTYARSFNDIKSGNNDIFSIFGGQYAAGTGYDLSSGLGSPNLSGPSSNGLASTLCADAQEDATSSVTSLSPSSGSVTGGTSVTITGTGFEVSGIPVVAGVTFGETPAESFSVTSPTTIVARTAPQGQPKKLRDFVPAASESDVTVVFSSGHTTIGPAFSYQTLTHGHGVPAVLSVGPSGGPASGGTTVRIYGTGFNGASAVDFGGVAAASYSVKSDSLIVAVSPPDTSTSCLAASHTSSSGLCQSDITVTTATGTSAVVPDLRPFSGTLLYSGGGIPYVKSSCHCEIFPTLTEFDFQAAPTITSVINRNATHGVPDAFPSGGNEMVLGGHGFNWLTINDVTIGDPTQAANEDYSILRVTSSQVYFVSTADPNPSPAGDAAAVAVSTEGGNSNSMTLQYGGIPEVTSVSQELLPSAGGAILHLYGSGFGDGTLIDDIQFDTAFNNPPTAILGSLNFAVNSTTEITVLSPSLVPGNYIVSVDALYGNSFEYSIPIGSPALSYETLPLTDTSVEVAYPTSPAILSSTGNTCVEATAGLGDCTMTLTGVNLGSSISDVSAAYVGTVPATVTNFQVIGSQDTVTITVPAAFDGIVGTYTVFLNTTNGPTPDTIEAVLTYT